MQEGRNRVTEHPKDYFGTFYRTKGYGEKQGSSSINRESPGSSGWMFIKHLLCQTHRSLGLYLMQMSLHQCLISS